MKTRAYFESQVGTIRSKALWMGFTTILMIVVAVLVMRDTSWIARHTGQPLAIGCYLSVPVLVPALAFWFTWKLKAFTKGADLTCPTCGKSIIGSSRDLKKVVTENKCPWCGGELYAT
jgi:predicted RNA-binding Zn-ribbon protein involved in translation (DUF1610 family)